MAEDSTRAPGVYFVSQTDSGWNRADRGVFHGAVLDERERYQPLCGRAFTVRPLLTRDMGKMATRRPCSRCYGPAMKALTVLREDQAALQEASTST